MFVKNILLLALVCGAANVLCKGQKKVACALDDSRCTTTAADSLYKSLVKGRPDIGVPSSDPLHQHVIFGFVKDLNYTLTDANLFGMTDCTVKKHSMNLQHNTWNFVLYCPKLIMEANYEAYGFIADNHFEGKGQCKIVQQKYNIGMRGGFDPITATNGKAHFRIGQFDFDLLEVVGNVKYEFSNLYHGDEVKSQSMHKYLNENWKTISSYTHHPAMHAFMSKMMENFNIFLEVVPANELFYKNV